MGTRGSLGFIVEDKEYLAYNHFDSYPDGLGEEVLQFIEKINKEDGWVKFRENAKNVIQLEGDRVTDTEIQEKYKKYADLGVSDKTLEDPYCLFRDIQDSWMEEIYKGELQHFFFNNDFIHDSLFCEYAYIINLDTMKLEFYDGFQKKSQKGNRFGETPNEDDYYPCRLIAVFDLEKIIDSDDVDEIVKKMNNICESKKDDPSVITYFRKSKLDAINEIGIYFI
jgi:hypothetical protein